MEYKGKIWCFDDNVDTDMIVPARYLNISDHSQLAKYCFAVEVSAGRYSIDSRRFIGGERFAVANPFPQSIGRPFYPGDQ